jgi:O-antigen/teichoic acid export membrane protein
MIGKMLNDSEVGIYSAAVKISEAWYFIPTAIATSVFPAIIKSKQKSKQLYLKRMQKLYDFSTWSSIGFALLITFFSGIIINVLYGDEYARAASVLSVHIWAGVFVFMGSIASKWVINENYTKNALLRTLIASLINIFLNVMLISVLGILGAALSTLISYGFVNFFSLFFFKKTRECFYLELKSFNLLRLFNVK